MEKDKEFWRVESTKYKELEPMLDKARLRIAELEKENTQAFSNIFSAPEDAMEELKRLKTELLETRKAKANSEAREASARKELAQLRGYGEAIKPAELHDLRSENQRLERELSRAKVDLDAIMARLAIYDRTAVQDSATPLSLRSPRESDVGGGGDPALQPAPGADVYRELQEIRNVWHEDKNELDKVRPFALSSRAESPLRVTYAPAAACPCFPGPQASGARRGAVAGSTGAAGGAALLLRGILSGKREEVGRHREAWAAPNGAPGGARPQARGSATKCLFPR